MASRKSLRTPGRKSGRSAPYLDQSVPANWSTAQLVQRLKDLDIVVPPTLKRAVLLSLYEQNVGRRVSVTPVTPTVGGTSAITFAGIPPQNIANLTNEQGNYFSSADGPIASTSTATAGRSDAADQRAQTARMDTPTPTNENLRLYDVNNANINNMAAPTMNQVMMQSLQQTMSAVATLLSKQLTPAVSTQVQPAFTLEQVYAGAAVGGQGPVHGTSSATLTSAPTGGMGLTPRSYSSFPMAMCPPGIPPVSSRFGVPSESLPFMDTVSSSLRRQITEGKDVNLAALLIPYFDAPTASPCHHDQGRGRDDPRLKKALTIAEYVTAFGRYKRIMCRQFEHRREELDQYEAHILEVYHAYGMKYYQYHKLFSLRAASFLEQLGVKVDWSQGDRKLLQLVTGNAKFCGLCGEVSHDASFCHLQTEGNPTIAKKPQYGGPTASTSRPSTSELDMRGRKRIFHNGAELCNNFNALRGCTRAECAFAHICITCKSSKHGKDLCDRQRDSVKSSPANVNKVG
jgi:hypothetical protein